MSAGIADNPSFNPHTQPVTMFYPDGQNLTIPLTDFNAASTLAIQLCVIFAAQIGACTIILFLLAVMTAPEKRRTLLFAINLFSLAAVIIRGCLQINYWLGPWFDTYNYMSYDVSDIPSSAVANSVAMATFQLIIVFCTQASLILQVRVVYASLPGAHRIMTAASVMVAVLVSAIWIHIVVSNNVMTMKLLTYSGSWVYPTGRALYAFSICFYSFAFISKLAMAIKRRRTLGLQKFGPLQIVFIMGCQTMLVPAIFSIAENLVKFDGLSSLTSALVVISLPLSSMWAGAHTESPSPSNMGESYQRVFRSNPSTMTAPSISRGGGGTVLSNVTPISMSSAARWPHNTCNGAWMGGRAGGRARLAGDTIDEEAMLRVEKVFEVGNVSSASSRSDVEMGR